MEKREQIIQEIRDELTNAEYKHPTFPVDIIHMVSVMNEEAGESIRAALNHTYEKEPIYLLKKELRQTAAMCIRVLENINHLK